MILGLSIILVLVLFLPFTAKIVERNLEVFLFIMGISAVLVSEVLDSALIVKSAGGSNTYNLSCYYRRIIVPLASKTF